MMKENHLNSFKMYLFNMHRFAIISPLILLVGLSDFISKIGNALIDWMSHHLPLYKGD